MKKILAITLMCALCLCSLVGCGITNKPQPVTDETWNALGEAYTTMHKQYQEIVDWYYLEKRDHDAIINAENEKLRAAGERVPTEDEREKDQMDLYVDAMEDANETMQRISNIARDSVTEEKGQELLAEIRERNVAFQEVVAAYEESLVTTKTSADLVIRS